MPITKHTDQSTRLTTFTATGITTLSDILKIINSFKDEPPTKDILWDFSEADVGDTFSISELESTAEIANAELGIREGSKTAFVATTDHVYGLIRMYATHLEFQKIAHEVQIFRDLKKAHQWLSGDTGQSP